MIRIVSLCVLVALLGLPQGCATAGATADKDGSALLKPPPLTPEQIIEQADTQARDALARKLAALEGKLTEARNVLNGARDEERKAKEALALASAGVKNADAAVKTAEAAVNATKSATSCVVTKGAK